MAFSKTTAIGILSFFITTFTVLTAVQIPTALATPAETHYLAWGTFVMTILMSLFRAWLGLLQGDAPPNPSEK
jgi:hypothetical protein